MAQLVIQFAISYIVGRLTEPKAPRLGDLTGFKSDYGGTIPLIFGPEVRASQGTVMWATQIKETVHKHKPAADFLFGLVGALLPKRKTYTYSIDLAVLLCGNPIRRVVKIWMNNKLVFDAGASTALVFTSADGTHQLFNTLRVYQGTMTQTPDPTMEAADGMGNVPAYLGSSYVVIDELQLETWGNGVPSVMEFLVEEATDARLNRVVEVMIAASGIDTMTVSTTSLDASVRGFTIESQGSVAEAFSPLISAYQFDLADQGGQIRAIHRGRYPKTVITADQLAGHQGDQEQPERIRWTRAPEVTQPREVTVNFIDPARDYQPNSQVARRQAGSAQSNITVNTGLTLTADECQRVADEVLWEAWSGRQVATTSTDETRDDVMAAEVHAFETPNGIDTYRVVRRSKGANNVINLELRADRPLIYGDSLPGVPSTVPGGVVVLPGVLNDPVFIEPPSNLAAGELWIALSAQLAGGGHDPNFGGVVVYVATADVEANYRNAGASNAAAYMGVLTADLPLYGGANPDGGNTLSVDLTMSGGILESVSAGDAATGLVNLAAVQDAGGGNTEFVTFQDAAATGPYQYDDDTLYRGLHGSTDALHATGSAIAMLDDALFRYAFEPDTIGVPLYFRFVQVGQALADATPYLYTPLGTGYGGGAGGVPMTPTGLVATPGIEGAVLNWNANASTDNVTAYEVWRAPGLGAAFGAAALVATVNALTWTDTGLSAATGYTYFLRAVNVVGPSAETAGENLTTSAVALLEAIYLPSTFVPGLTTASQILLLHKFTKPATFPANFAGSQFGATANATGATVFTIWKALAAAPNVFTQIGTITVGAGGVSAVFASTGGTAKAFAAADVLKVQGPLVPDATLYNPHASLLAPRT